MITIADLQTSLIDLLHEIKGSEVKIIIGGGFGIYLKAVHVAKEGCRTLFREWPEPRSTNDLDLFLRPELLIESEKLKPMAEIFLPHPFTFSMMKLFAFRDRLGDADKDFGMIRLRESPYYRPELRLDEFMSTMQELFP
jgi:hypothetical protein